MELPSILSAQGSQVTPESTEVSAPNAPRPETPSTAQPLSEETTSTTPTTPSSLQKDSALPAASASPTQTKPPPRHTAAVPIVPVVPKPASRTSSGAAVSDQNVVGSPEAKSVLDDFGPPSTTVSGEEATNPEDPDTKSTLQPIKNAPKLWTGLFKGPTGEITTATGNGIQANPSALVSTSTFSKTNSESLADALRTFNASAADAKLAFIKPRGLVNTGNMCYMNSVS